MVDVDLEKEKKAIPDWDEYFMTLAQVVKLRANCVSRKVGAVIVKNRRIIATGYNGTPMGVTNCLDGGCERCNLRKSGIIASGQDEEKCICIHAEQNAITQSAYHGISTQGSTLYVTTSACSWCAKMIINAGIVRVVFNETHHNKIGIQLLHDAHVEVTNLTL
ncbi:MAG: dCMP deaminase family protein [Candidatus Roizmanbacteria bacterium]